MRCSSCEPLLDRYVEATLSPRQMSAVSSHLRTCDGCTSLLTELRVVDALLATTDPVELAPNFTFAVMAEVQELRVHEPRRVSIWALLAFYLVGAWIALTAAYVTLGGRFPMLQHAVSSSAAAFGDTIAALSGVVHGLGTTTPTVVALVSTVLFIDALLAGMFIYFHRSVRPRLATVFSRSEAS